METGNPLGLGPLQENEQLVVEGICSCLDYGEMVCSFPPDGA
jgi:hypothetical protein